MPIGSLQATVQEWGTGTEASNPAVLRRNAAEVRKVKAARICVAEHWRGERHKLWRSRVFG